MQYVIVRIIVVFLSRLSDKNINEERNNNFHLYSNPVLVKFFITCISLVSGGCLVSEKKYKHFEFN